MTTNNFQPSNSLGNYLPEQVWLPEDPETFQSEIKRLAEDQAKMINRKDTGSYEQVEQLINQQYFGSTPQDKRYVYRIVINTGALLNAAPTAVNHNLNGGNPVPNTWLFTRIYGFARNPTTPVWIPLPNGGIHNCSVQVTATQVIITPTVNLSAFTTSFVVLEYVKN